MCAFYTHTTITLIKNNSTFGGKWLITWEQNLLLANSKGKIYWNAITFVFQFTCELTQGVVHAYVFT